MKIQLTSFTGELLVLADEPKKKKKSGPRYGMFKNEFKHLDDAFKGIAMSVLFISWR